MKSVLIAIQPYHVFLIIARIMGWDILQEKKVEVRKDFPKDSAWNKITHIYCSRNRKSFKRIPKQYQPFMEKLLGKVIGEFVCDRIDEFHEWQLTPGGKYQEFEENDLQRFLTASCLSWEEVYAYRQNLPYYKPLYGWHISDLIIYDKPKELRAFRIYCEGRVCFKCKRSERKLYSLECSQLDSPPQSWCYVEE